VKRSEKSRCRDAPVRGTGKHGEKCRVLKLLGVTEVLLRCYRDVINVLQLAYHCYEGCGSHKGQ
jgi:hypothetical protein